MASIKKNCFPETFGGGPEQEPADEVVSNQVEIECEHRALVVSENTITNKY